MDSCQKEWHHSNWNLFTAELGAIFRKTGQDFQRWRSATLDNIAIFEGEQLFGCESSWLIHYSTRPWADVLTLSLVPPVNKLSLHHTMHQAHRNYHHPQEGALHFCLIKFITEYFTTLDFHWLDFVYVCLPARIRPTQKTPKDWPKWTVISFLWRTVHEWWQFFFVAYMVKGTTDLNLFWSAWPRLVSSALCEPFITGIRYFNAVFQYHIPTAMFQFVLPSAIGLNLWSVHGFFMMTKAEKSFQGQVQRALTSLESESTSFSGSLPKGVGFTQVPRLQPSKSPCKPVEFSVFLLTWTVVVGGR